MLQGVLEKFQLLLGVKNKAFFRELNLSPLDNTTDPDLERLKSIFTFFTAGTKWSSEEKASLQQIEIIRKQYANENTKVVIRDFGSGHNNEIKDEKAMEGGVNREVLISEVYKTAATKERLGVLMFKIVRDFKFNRCLELGTNLGISAAYQLCALKLNDNGHLDTIEGADIYAKLAEKSLRTIGYNNFNVHVGKFSDVLPQILSPSLPIDFVFIDGHHDEIATLKYFEIVYPYLTPNAMIIFDDISWSAGMKNAWQTIYHDPRIKASVDIKKWGICFIDKTKTSSSLQYHNLIPA